VVLLCLAASIYSVVGGVGGGVYMAYFACTSFLVIVMVYFFGSFFPNTESSWHGWGFAYDGNRRVVDSICEIVQCGKTHDNYGNLDNSPLTFLSLRGFLSGIAFLQSKRLYIFIIIIIFQCCCPWPWSLALRCPPGQILSPWPWPWP